MAKYVTINKGKLNPSAGLVTASEYAVMEGDKGRFLLLKMSNDSGRKVNGFTVRVKQYDASGVLLSENEFTEKGYLVESGSVFGLKDGISLDGRCESVEAEITGVLSGKYMRKSEGGKTEVSYVSDKKELTLEEICEKADGKRYGTSSRLNVSPLKLAIVSVLAILLAAAVFSVYLGYFSRTVSDFVYNGCGYSFVNADRTEVSLDYYKGKDKTVKIPEKVGDFTLKTISDGAFSNGSGVKEIIIEGSPKIASGAFRNATGLEKIDFGKCTSISRNAFSGCGNLREVNAPYVTDIGETAFADCGNLKTVTIPEDKEIKIGYRAFANSGIEKIKVREITLVSSSNVFEGCLSLKELSVDKWKNLPTVKELFGRGESNLEKIEIGELYGIVSGFCRSLAKLTEFKVRDIADPSVGDGAFCDCKALSSFVLPKEVTAIGEKAFENTNISKFNGSAATFVGKRAFAGNTALKKFTFNNAVLTISDGVFDGCTALETVELAPTCKEIGWRSFAGCSALKKIELTDKVASLGTECFAECSSLETVDFPETVEKIGEKAFRNCSSLKKIVVPETVTRIESSAFSGCSALAEITVPFIGRYKDSNEQFSIIFGQSGYALPSSLATVTVTGEGTVPDYAFSECGKIKEINFRKEISRIGSRAFSGCLSLMKVPLAEGLKYIGDDAFSKCSSLESVYIPDSVETIGARSFGDCNSLKKISLPYLGSSRYSSGRFDYLFYGSGTVPSSVEKVTVRSGKVGENAFSECYNVKEIVISGNAGEIGSYAFSECRSLKSVSFSGVTYIGDHAFYDCYSLAELTIPETVTYIGYGSFTNCYRLYIVCNYSSLQVAEGGLGGVQEYAIGIYPKNETPETVVTEGYKFLVKDGNAYLIDYEGESTELNFPTSFTSNGIIYNSYDIPKYFFYNPYKEYKIEKATLNAVKNIGCYAFGGISSLKTVEFSETVENIADNAFANCGSLSVARFKPNGALRNVGANAFWGCSSLEIINLPENVETAGNAAFADCSSLKEATLGSKLTFIENNLFNNCVALEKVGVPSTVTEIGMYAFYNCQSLDKIVLPTGLSSIGEYAFSGCVSLYEVYNLSNLPIVVKSDKFGYAGYYAYMIHTETGVEMERAEIDGYYFVRPYGKWKMIKQSCSGSSLNLGRFSSADKTIDDYSIADGLFYGNGTVTKVVIGKEVNELGKGLFSNCGSLKEVKIESEKLTAIPENCFYNCMSLEKADIPNGIKQIGNSAFKFCSSLDTVTLPSSLTAIGEEAFSGCDNLIELYNLSGLSIARGATDYGAVAARALVIHKSSGEAAARRATVGNYRFIEAADGWKLYRVDGYDYIVNLPRKITANGEVLAEKYEVLSRIFSNGSYYGRIAIPKAVEKFENNALFTGISGIFYEGSESEWKAFSKSLNYNKNADMYYIAKCVHEYGQWKYDSYGNVDYNVRNFNYDRYEAGNCLTKGKTIYKCPDCGEESVETDANYGNHIVVDGKCTVCGATRKDYAVKGSISNIVSVSGGSAFKVGDDGKYDFATSKTGTQTLTLTLKCDMTLTLDFAFGDGSEYVSVYCNSGLQGSVYSDGSRSFNFKKGDKITISIVVSSVPSGGSASVKFGITASVLEGGKKPTEA